jgi:hypothetical protein
MSRPALPVSGSATEASSREDVGRLVFDVTVPIPGETLFASAKSVSFEESDPDKLGAAICAAVG